MCYWFCSESAGLRLSSTLLHTRPPRGTKPHDNQQKRVYFVPDGIFRCLHGGPHQDQSKYALLLHWLMSLLLSSYPKTTAKQENTKLHSQNVNACIWRGRDTRPCRVPRIHAEFTIVDSNNRSLKRFLSRSHVGVYFFK